MKKLTAILVLALTCTALLFTGCKKEKKVLSCDELATRVSEAAMVFVTNPTQTSCEAYVDAIRDYYDGCALIPAYTREQYDAWLESTNCSGY